MTARNGGGKAAGHGRSDGVQVAFPLVRVMSGIGRLLVATFLAGVLVAALMMPYFLGMGLAANEVTGAIADVQANDFDAPPAQRSVIEDDTGKPLTYVYSQDRQIVPLSSISEYLQKGVLAIEDHRYYKHSGVDWTGTLRALLKTQSGATQGGSTITQQYVKNYLFLVKAQTDADRAAAIEQTPIRKLREAKLALQLNLKYSKDDVLARYLNLVAFGPSTYGAQASAQHFFGVDASDLTLPQAALMAGMVNNPNKFNPITHSATALARRNQVLAAMVTWGAISAKVAKQAEKAPLGLNPTRTPNGCLDQAATKVTTNGYYCQYVLDYLSNNGLDYSKLATGGYTIKTNLDPRAMNDAKTSVDNNASPTANKRIANVMAIIQPGTSTRRVVAMVANHPFGSKANIGQTEQRLTTTFAPLGAGSTFKVFTAAAALQLGMGVQNQLAVPVTYTSPLAPSHKFTNPEAFPPSITMAQALAESPNTAFVALEDQVGLDKVVQMGVQLGLRGYNYDAGVVSPQFAGSGDSYANEVVRQKIASFTLGVTPVSPLELANVGATLDSSGTWCPPSPVDTVFDRNNKPTTLKTATCEQVIPASLASTLSRAMEGDLQSVKGTGHASAQKAGWTRIAAGKTGTTQDYKSSAYLGFTPQYAGAVMVWDYLPRPMSICVNPLRSCTTADAESKIATGNGGMAGGSTPAATWLDAMNALLKGVPEQDFGQDDAVYVSGKATNQVPDVIGESVQQATANLQQHGFQVKSQAVTGSGGAINVVVGQSPGPNQAALPGITVNIGVSTGGG
ncbi:MAG: transglycosylase domain-containing protein [Actinomycetota bacterium]|nr:transglycosylase domain-containing protein [Actinomycetota bacterium]